MRPIVLVLGGCALAVGCAQVLGLQDWKDPPGGTGGSTTGTGGSGGATTSSSAGSGGTSSVSTTSTTTTSSGGKSDAGDITCADGLRNGLETDVDCGGDVCPPCGDGLRCENPADCKGGGCVAGVCVTLDGGSPCQTGPDPTCHDCLRNGFESDVDCGGDDCLPCAAGLHCGGDFDCISASCVAGTCEAGSPGRPCKGAGDCASQQCSAGQCWTGACCQ